MDLSGAIALVTAIAALIVAIVTHGQLKHSRFALGVDLLLKLEAQFDQPEMKAARKSAAKALIPKLAAHEKLVSADLEPVLDFFETLGLLVSQHAVDEELAWNSFSYWLLRYFDLAHDQIKARRTLESDWTYYENFERFAKRLAEVEATKRNLSYAPKTLKRVACKLPC